MNLNSFLQYTNLFSNIFNTLTIYFLQKIDSVNEVTDNNLVSSELKENALGIHSRTVKDILQECVQGQRILQVYARQKVLTEKNRNKICNMILTDFENCHQR